MEGKKLGQRIKLPPLTTIFPIHRNPLHERPEVKEMIDLVGEFSSMPLAHYAANNDSCLFSAYFHPFVKDMTRYLNLCKAMTMFLVIDDHTECDWGDVDGRGDKCDLILNQVEQCFERLLDGTTSKSMANWKPYVVCLYICFEDIFRELSMAQKIRMAHEYRKWGQGNRKEGEVINSGQGFKTVEHYLEIRKLSVGLYPCCMMIEYADGIELTDEEWQRLRNYMEHAACCITLANDFQSIEKEMRDQKDHPHRITNVVALIMDWDNCSVEEALIKTERLNNDYEKRTQKIRAQLLKEPNVSKNMRHVIDNIQYMVSGNLVVGLVLQRYTKVSPIDE